MKTTRLFAALTLAVTATAIPFLTARLRAADPGLKISPQNTNQVKLSVTNSTSGVSYEIYRTPVLDDPAYPWTLHLIGTLNQTNFFADYGVETDGFFKATEGRDWDSDGILNDRDGQPSNASVGALTIVIDSPTQGQVLQ